MLSFWSEHTYYLFVILKISGNFSGKGLVTKKGFKGSFADAASSAKVMTLILLLDTHLQCIFLCLIIMLRFLSLALDICCPCWRSKFGFLLFEKATWKR